MGGPNRRKIHGGSAAVTFSADYTVDIKTGFENAGYAVRSETIRRHAG
ncbi:MAG: hypothetical protein LBL83_12250 [Clostridiales bacterium]|nr:hypothetical protein [Clostridiales bacterium]